MRRKQHNILILSGVGLFLLSCLGSQTPVPTIDPNAVQTYIVQTADALALLNTPTSTTQSTLTSIPTSTEISAEAYVQFITTRFLALQEATAELTQIHNEWVADPSRAQDAAWTTHAMGIITRVGDSAREITGIPNYPPQYATFHAQIQQLAAESDALHASYNSAYADQDLNALNNAATHLGNLTTALDRATVEMTALSTLPTAAIVDTPVPTFTPLVVFPPTSAPSVSYDNNGDGQVTCADFSLQSEAQQAFQAGHTQLDGNDNDGRACESLP